MRVAWREVVMSAPAVLGALLVVVSLVDRQQLHAGRISPHAMLNREAPLLILGLISVLTLLAFGVVWLVKGEWRRVLLSLGSVVAFLVCFIVVGAMDASILYAT
jgi:hypothetical protein